jgi:hypothetical protein
MLVANLRFHQDDKQTLRIRAHCLRAPSLALPANTHTHVYTHTQVLSVFGYGGFVHDTRVAASQDQPVGIVSDRTSFYAEAVVRWVGGWAMCMIIIHAESFSRNEALRCGHGSCWLSGDLARHDCQSVRHSSSV